MANPDLRDPPPGIFVMVVRSLSKYARTMKPDEFMDTKALTRSIQMAQTDMAGEIAKATADAHGAAGDSAAAASAATTTANAAVGASLTGAVGANSGLHGALGQDALGHTLTRELR